MVGQGSQQVASRSQTLRLIADSGMANLNSGIQMPIWTMANNTATTVFKDFGDSQTVIIYKVSGDGKVRQTDQKRFFYR